MNRESGNDPKGTIRYRYDFVFSGDRRKEVKIVLDAESMNIIKENKDSYPPWTALHFHKCSNCPLDERQHPSCPISVNIHELLQDFSDCLSHESADILIDCESRSYTAHTTLQRGLGSLIGIYMVTSGCPNMEKLKPMVRYHLPFATEEETVYRVLSMYLLAQYFLQKRGSKPDWEMKELVEVYRDVELVNRGLCKRITNSTREDGCVNAVIILDCFAKSVITSIDKQMIREVEVLFDAY